MRNSNKKHNHLWWLAGLVVVKIIVVMFLLISLMVSNREIHFQLQKQQLEAAQLRIEFDRATLAIAKADVLRELKASEIKAQLDNVDATLLKIQASLAEKK